MLLPNSFISKSESYHFFYLVFITKFTLSDFQTDCENGFTTSALQPLLLWEVEQFWEDFFSSAQICQLPHPFFDSISTIGTTLHYFTNIIVVFFQVLKYSIFINFTLRKRIRYVIVMQHSVRTTFESLNLVIQVLENILH